MNTKTTYFVLIAVPLMWLLAWLTYEEKRIELIPVAENAVANYSTYSDQTEGGNSSIAILNSEKFIRFKTTLREGHPFPYTGLVLFPKENKFFDLSAFDELRLTAEAVNSKRLPITIGVEMQGKEVPLQYEKELSEGKSSYVIPLDAFSVPSWWFKNNGVTASSLEEINWSKIKAINIQNGSLLKPGDEDIISVYQLSVKQNTVAFFIITLTIIVALELLMVLILVFRKTRRERIIAVSYEAKKVANIKDVEMEKLLNHIASHYHEALNAEALQQATGVSKQKIPTLFKDHLGITLKQYLNTLRLNEAKRLLETSDIPVNEIALEVGYGNISHFNRVFKANENISPLQYRNQKRAL